MAGVDAIRDRQEHPLMDAVADMDADASMRKMIRIETPPELIELEPRKREECHDGQCPDRQEVAKPTIEEVTNEVSKELIEKKVDQHGNLVGSENDLLKDNEASGEKILILEFCTAHPTDTSRLVDALQAKGFGVDTMTYPLPRPTDFSAKLDDYQQVWLWSGSQGSRLKSSHARELARWWNDGSRGLCILADNSPYEAEANKVLRAILPTAQISGDHNGESLLKARGDFGSGFIAKHPLFHNIESLFEGTTISTVWGGGMSPVCYASNDMPLVSVYEGNGSRLVVHCGFTSFLPEAWADAGISRFAVNCGGWLAGKDRSTNQSDLVSNGGR